MELKNKNIIGIYFSGTGNTKHCLKTLVQELDSTAKYYAIEDSNAVSEIKQADFVIFAYPVYFSNLPKIVRDFIECNKDIFKGKQMFIIATM